jgi:hypothetical protein
MANLEHLAILKKGAKVWNAWREENPDVRPFLIEADLRRAVLPLANLAEADLRWAELSRADLFSADLRGAVLQWADLREAVLREADFAGAVFGSTGLGNVNLSKVKGLEDVRHVGPSTVGIDTIYISGGDIPESFLRGAGVPDDFITNIGSLVDKATEYYSAFISYSSRDDDFAKRLHADLQDSGVRCWFAPEDLKIGDRIRPRIDASIRLHDKLLLVLSENSVASDRVEYEVETALARERREKRLVLFPIRLDDAVFDTDAAWASYLKDSRHIGDFRTWKDHDKYQVAFDRLMQDLKAESEGS